MSDFASWTLEKKFVAASFYLQKETNLGLNQLQTRKLKALQLQVTYGGFVSNINLPEYATMQTNEIAKIQNEWKRVQNLHRLQAVKRFLNLMDLWFPKWTRNLEILETFEMQWFSHNRNKQIVVETPQYKELLPKLGYTQRRVPRPIVDRYGNIPLGRYSTTRLREIDKIRTISERVRSLPKVLNVHQDITATMYDIKQLCLTRIRSEKMLSDQTLQQKVKNLETENKFLSRRVSGLDPNSVS